MKSASKLLELFTAHWTSAILASGVEYEVFSRIEAGAVTVDTLAAETGLDGRSMQVLLDGLVAIEALSCAGGRYANTPTASAHLVRGKPGYMGGFGRIVLGAGDGGMRQWSRLPEALRLGKPIAPETILDPESPFWDELVTALMPLSCEVAVIAAQRIGLGDGKPASILDVGGGAGAYAVTWLDLNPDATVTQIDWAPVNALAIENVRARGTSARFVPVDGDFQTVSFGDAAHDVVVFSNIFHHESPGEIRALLDRTHRALKPGGRVVISEFMLHDDRNGPSFSARFGAGMVLQTPRGSNYRSADYLEWVQASGFVGPIVDRTHPLSTLVIAQKPAP
ncbi:MAG: class I SAM-dependent methyltransferase [Polyangiaceae bacterium]|nr:class I SAM-dependent methyltransferase [Polyangiaceae bacterium]